MGGSRDGMRRDGMRRDGVRARAGAWARWILRVGMPVACASSLAAQRPPVGAAVGTAIGDSLRFAVTIDSLDAARQVAWFAGRGSARFLVLAVVPGKDIELIVPDGSTRRLIGERGGQRVDLSRTTQTVDAARTAAAQAQARADYARCVANRAAEQRRIELAAQRAQRKTDPNARVVEPSPAVDPSRDRLLPCSLLAATTRYVATQLPPREPADRYLLVLAADRLPTMAELTVRLATLTAQAPDVRSTMEAVATGLLLGTRTTWGGRYLAW